MQIRKFTLCFSLACLFLISGFGNSFGQWMETFNPNPMGFTAWSSYNPWGAPCSPGPAGNYLVTNNLMNSCGAFPAAGGIGDFLVIDNTPGSQGPIYASQPNQLPGCYYFTMDVFHAYGGAGTQADLMIMIDGNPVGGVSVPTVFGWNTFGFPVQLPTGAGIIEIHQINSGSNMAYAIDNISLDPYCDVPVVPVTYCVDDCEVCFDAKAFTSTCITNATYSWNMGDGTTLSGTNICHTYSSDGTFNVCLTVEVFNNINPTVPCNTWTKCFKVVMSGCYPTCRAGGTPTNTLDVAPLESRPTILSTTTNIDMTLSPNPTQGELTVSHGFGNQGQLTMQLWSMDGKMLLERTMEASQAESQFDISSLPAGAYQVRLKDEAGNQAIKSLVKE